VKTEELQSLFEIPEKDEISEYDWQRWEQELEQGLNEPLLVSLYEGSGDDRWLDQKGLVAVAAEKEIEQLPVVMFYHTSGRQSCGVPASCTDQLKEAIEKATGEKLFADGEQSIVPRPVTPMPPGPPPVPSPS
jgi:hypothetical protein